MIKFLGIFAFLHQCDNANAKTFCIDFKCKCKNILPAAAEIRLAEMISKNISQKIASVTYTVSHLTLSESKHKKGHVIDTFWL